MSDKTTYPKCRDCPVYPETEEGVYADNTGCLPEFYEMKVWHRDLNKVWACHNNCNRPCGGYLDAAEVEYQGEELVTYEQYNRVDSPELFAHEKEGLPC